MKPWTAITGSSNGIGAALAEIFAKEGHSIILHGRNKKDLEGMHKKITSYNVDAEVVEGDIRSQKTLENMASLSREKNFGVLVNNVGYRCPFLTLDNISDENIEDMISISLIPALRLSRDAYRHFLKRGGGCIININSIIGLEPRKQRSLYAAARSAIVGFAESLRLEANEHNIRILGVYPARVKTKPEFEYGWDVNDAARKMYEFYAAGKYNNLILDFSKEPEPKAKKYAVSGEVHVLSISGKLESFIQ